MVGRLIAISLAIAVGARAASAYEFEIRARTVGQGHELRSLRFLSEDLELDRRRFTQILSLDIWDLTGRLRALARGERPRPGPRIHVSGYLRVDHDYGDYTTGRIALGSRVFDAIDVIPELERTSLQLDVLYLHVTAEDLAGGWLDLTLGRQLGLHTLDWFSMDGLTARVESPWHVAAEVFGGLRVRESSPLASGTHEPDGTSGALCHEYVEGAVPGSGAWRPIDRALMPDDEPFRSDFEICPQREELMPTYGVALEASGLDWLSARVAYRRSVSPTVGLIGAVDRLENPDLGLYPDERGQAPAWGVNEELVSASVRAPLSLRGGALQLSPYAGVRYSLLHAAVDTVHAGARVAAGAHALEPELYHSLPIFDGDSIFNVFSIEPYTDLRVTYDFAPEKARWSAYLRPWLRRFSTEDAGEAAPGAEVDASSYAGGVHGGLRWLERERLLGRFDLFWEDGYGGRRLGGYATGRWRAHRDLELGLRLSVIDFGATYSAGSRATTVGAQLGATYVFNRGVALSAVIEENANRIHESQLGVFAILDLAFRPET